MNLELAVNVLEVRVDGVIAHKQLFDNTFFRESIDRQFKDFFFSICQLLVPLWFGKVPELIENHANDRRIPGTQPFHAPPTFSLPWIAGVIEFFDGALLLFGLFTRIVAFILSGEMAVAYFMVHFQHGLSPLINHGELAVAYCFVFLYLVFKGGGSWSLDALRMRKPHVAGATGGG